MSIHIAAGNAHVASVIGILRDDPSGVDVVNAEGWTALHVVAAQGDRTSPEHADIVSLLLSAGADPNARTPLGWTPILLIAINGSARSLCVAKALLAGGADIHARANDGITDWRILWQHGDEVRKLFETHQKQCAH